MGAETVKCRFVKDTRTIQGLGWDSDAKIETGVTVVSVPLDIETTSHLLPVYYPLVPCRCRSSRTSHRSGLRWVPLGSPSRPHHLYGVRNGSGDVAE